MTKKDLMEMVIRLQDRISKLEDRIRMLENNGQTVSIPSIWTTDGTDTCIGGGPHDYPTPWFGTIPPNCRKCGKQGQSFTITCSSNADKASRLDV